MCILFFRIGLAMKEPNESALMIRRISISSHPKKSGCQIATIYSLQNFTNQKISMCSKVYMYMDINMQCNLQSKKIKRLNLASL